MLREALFAKIHHAVVTECDVEFSGSITIDEALIDAAGILPNEKVLVADCENGNRFETYVHPAPRGSGMIGINAAAARLTAVGHRVTVFAFCRLTPEEFKLHRPKVVICNRSNGVEQLIEYNSPVMA